MVTELATTPIKPTPIKLRAVAKSSTLTPGISSAPLWKEKWSVKLKGEEEFHITDHLLKMRSDVDPKVLTVLKLVDSELGFEQTDFGIDFEVNGEILKIGRLKIGDKIKVRPVIKNEHETNSAHSSESVDGGALFFEIDILEAPKVENAGPVIITSPVKTDDLPPTPSDHEPTLTITHITSETQKNDGPLLNKKLNSQHLAEDKSFSKIELESTTPEKPAHKDQDFTHSANVSFLTQPWMPKFNSIDFRVPRLFLKWFWGCFFVASIVMTVFFTFKKNNISFDEITVNRSFLSWLKSKPITTDDKLSTELQKTSSRQNVIADTQRVANLMNQRNQALDELAGGEDLDKATDKMIDKVEVTKTINRESQKQNGILKTKSLQNAAPVETQKPVTQPDRVKQASSFTPAAKPVQSTGYMDHKSQSGILIGPFSKGLPIQNVIQAVEKLNRTKR